MKRISILALAMAVPAVLAAQAPAQQPVTDPITTSFRNRINGLERNVALAFDSIPESKFNYKPTPAQLSIGYIAQHVTNDNYFFCNNYGDKKGTRPDEETSTPDSVKATWPKDKLVAALKASFAFCQDAMTQINDAKLGEAFTMTAPNGSTRQVYRSNYVLGHALDLSDHYSQLANYMRLNGILPPSALNRPPR